MSTICRQGTRQASGFPEEGAAAVAGWALCITGLPTIHRINKKFPCVWCSCFTFSSLGPGRGAIADERLCERPGRNIEVFTLGIEHPSLLHSPLLTLALAMSSVGSFINFF